MIRFPNFSTTRFPFSLGTFRLPDSRFPRYMPTWVAIWLLLRLPFHLCYQVTWVAQLVSPLNSLVPPDSTIWVAAWVGSFPWVAIFWLPSSWLYLGHLSYSCWYPCHPSSTIWVAAWVGSFPWVVIFGCLHPDCHPQPFFPNCPVTQLHTNFPSH